MTRVQPGQAASWPSAPSSTAPSQSLSEPVQVSVAGLVAA